MDEASGVGVLDKAVVVLAALQSGPAGLTELVLRTGLSRATAHRLAAALETHRLLGRDPAGRFVLGPRLGELAAAAADPLLTAAAPVLARLRDETGESAQLYRREAGGRRCVAASERASGLRDTVPVGALLPMGAGSAAKVLLAWSGEAAPPGAAVSSHALAAVRRQGWAASVAEREPGVASVSAPVRVGERVVAAVSVSGPLDRLTRTPGRLHAAAVLRAAAELSTD